VSGDALVIYRKGLLVVLFFFILSGESMMVEAATSLIFLVSKRELTFLPCSIGTYWHYWTGMSSMMIDAAICRVFYVFLCKSLGFRPNPEFWKGLSKAWI
jgi:hypothetical protein